jgi:hypothetical protein
MGITHTNKNKTQAKSGSRCGECHSQAVSSQSLAELPIRPPWPVHRESSLVAPVQTMHVGGANWMCVSAQIHAVTNGHLFACERAYIAVRTCTWMRKLSIMQINQPASQSSHRRQCPAVYGMIDSVNRSTFSPLPPSCTGSHQSEERQSDRCLRQSP